MKRIRNLLSRNSQSMGNTKFFWKILGIFFVGCAYIGMILPAVPTTTFLLLALWAFSKGSPKLHHWVYNHPRFGIYVRNWSEKSIYPLPAKLMMIFCSVISLLFMYISGVSIYGLFGTGLFMLCWIIWAWKYPSNEAEFNNRIRENKKIGWLK